jgi:hypothetical protein
MQNLYGAQTILHSKSLCYSTPPERGHLSRTGHIGGYYMLVYTLWAEQVATRVTEPRRQEAHVAPNPVPPVHQSSPHVTAPPAEVIEISSGDSDEIS